MNVTACKIAYRLHIVNFDNTNNVITAFNYRKYLLAVHYMFNDNSKSYKYMCL